MSLPKLGVLEAHLSDCVEPLGWVDGIAVRIIQRAARRAPGSLSERLEEEWLADASQRHGPMSRLSFSSGVLLGRDGAQ